MTTRVGGATYSKNPQPLTRGVTNYPSAGLKQPQASVDWLQYSVEWPPSLRSWPSNHAAAIEVLKSALPGDSEIRVTGEILHPIAGYDSGMAATHARLFWHHLDRMEHIGVLMTGEDLRAILMIPYPHDALIRWTVAKCKKISRLDFALDVFDRDADPRDIRQHWHNGEASTPARHVQELDGYTHDKVKGVTRATTVYVGSRDSDRQLRCYDKAAQTGKAGPWIRLELQCRNEQAWSLAKAMALYGVAAAGQNALRAFYRAPKLKWYQRATEGETVPIDPVGRRVTGTAAWINDVALPTIVRVAKEQAAHGDWEIYDAVNAALAEILRETK